jgi:cytochrome c biogenesis protein CcdA
MMKKIAYVLTFILTIIGLSSFQLSPLYIIAADETYDAVYFGSLYCSVCQNLETEDLAFERLEAQGVLVQKIILEEDSDNTSLFRNYQFTFDVPSNESMVPVIFVGDRYFAGRTDINNAIDTFEIRDIAQSTEMLEIMVAPPSDFSLVYFILLGFVDGVNPCAIAMLLLFISLLGFTKKKSILIPVALTFISAIFISYFLFGTILYQYLYQLRFLSFLVKTIPWIIVGISGILFLLNFYDFIVTMLQKYNLVKNQLPRGIQKFNRKMMERFTKKMDEGSKSIYVITFLIGLIISFTEFLCTGQAYLTAILHLIHFTDNVGRGLLLLAIYNLIFVLPLIIITLIAHKTQSIQSVSIFMREKLHWIKLFNSIVFLAILIYYLLFMI